MAEKDLFTTDIPTGAEAPSNAGRRVLESTRMALAPVPTPASVPGAVPPQNLEAEESVLGAMMIASGAIAAVSEILDASDFYRESHAKIYRAALQLYGKNEPVDAITLTNELEQRGELEEIGGRVRLHELARLVPATANARHYAEIVRENATLRGLIRAGGEIAQLGWEREGEPEELVARAEQLVYDLGERRADGEHGPRRRLPAATSMADAGGVARTLPSWKWLFAAFSTVSLIPRVCAPTWRSFNRA